MYAGQEQYRSVDRSISISGPWSIVYLNLYCLLPITLVDKGIAEKIELFKYDFGSLIIIIKLVLLSVTCATKK